MRPVTWEHALEAFIGKLRADNCTPATLKTYRTFLDGGRARRFREAHGVTHAKQLDAALLQAMKAEFLEDGLRAATVDDYVRMWRTFAKHCLENGWGVDAATLLVRGPRQPKRDPATFTADDEARLIAACPCERDRLLIRFALETGLRRSELANLTIDDIVDDDGDGAMIRVRQGKGNKDRAVPISEDLAADLAQYIRRDRPATPCRALFLTSLRRPHGDYGPLASGAIYHVWRRASQASGVRAWPHKARHTAATRWARDGLSPWAIQQALGHSTLDMTQKYVSAAAVDLRHAFNGQRRTLRGVDRVKVVSDVLRVLARAGLGIEDLVAAAPARGARR